MLKLSLSPAGLGAAATVASDCAVVAAFVASGPSGTVVLFLTISITKSF